MIWSTVGAQATDQGNCSNFKHGIPHCCKKSPSIIDLLPGVPKNQIFTSCCKAGVLASWGQDPEAAISAFQLSVGRSGTSNYTVKPPKDFYLLGPWGGYTSGAATIMRPSFLFSPDGRELKQWVSNLIFFHVGLHINSPPLVREYYKIQIISNCFIVKIKF